MPSLKNILKKLGVFLAFISGVYMLSSSSAETRKRLGIALVVIVAVSVVLLSLMWLVPGTAAFAAYSYFFRLLVSYGGINPWIARSASLVFAVLAYFSVRLILSRSKKRRRMGVAMILTSGVLLNLVIFACSISNPAVVDGQLFSQITGDPRAWYYVDEMGDWELFSQPGYHPETGIELKQMTIDSAKQYAKWKDQVATELKREKEFQVARKEEERRHQLRERLVDLSSVPQQSDWQRTIVLAVVCTDAAGSGTAKDTLCQHLVRLFENKGMIVRPTVFQPFFYSGGHFEKLCSGDNRVLTAVGIEKIPPVLLAKADFSKTKKTDLDELVYVRAQLVLRLNSGDTTRGPWTATVSGAGTDAMQATSNAVKRLVESIDLAEILSE